MIILISPAKSLNFDKEQVVNAATQPQFTEEAQTLVGVLKKYSPKRLAALMKINPTLAQLNFVRFQEWSLPFTPENSKQALLSFRGDVFLGINSGTLTESDFVYAQDHLRILSGLYGVLKPLDLIQAYRLEMGTSLKFRRNKNLYDFWGNKIAENIRKEVVNSESNVLVNLASKEYFKTVEPGLDGIKVITPVFKDFKNGEYKFIHVFGKKARGLMTRFMIDRKITNPDEMKLFDYEGYYYNDNLSSGTEWVFTRG